MSTVFEILAQQYRDWHAENLGGEVGVLAADDALESALVMRVHTATDYHEGDHMFEVGAYVLVWPRGYKATPIGKPAVRTYCGWIPALGNELVHGVEEFATLLANRDTPAIEKKIGWTLKERAPDPYNAKITRLVLECGPLAAQVHLGKSYNVVQFSVGALEGDDYKAKAAAHRFTADALELIAHMLEGDEDASAPCVDGPSPGVGVDDSRLRWVSVPVTGPRSHDLITAYFGV